jgi:hypothetical protein
MLCLLLFVATAILWFRSRTHLDEFYAYRPLSYRSVWSAEGRIYIFIWSAPRRFWGEPSMGFSGGDLSRLKYSVAITHQFGPFGYHYYHHTPSTNPTSVTPSGYIIMFPHWLVILPLAISLALALRRLIRRRSSRFRAANGLCLRCGYDIRATPNRCPECGHESPVVAPAGS